MNATYSAHPQLQMLMVREEDKSAELARHSEANNVDATLDIPINQQDRSYHPDYIKKKAIRVKIRMLDGHCCIGDCHVIWPDGRTSDVINDDRKFLILTDATVEGEHHVYNILTINKSSIEMIFELHRGPRYDSKPSE